MPARLVSPSTSASAEAASPGGAARAAVKDSLSARYATPASSNLVNIGPLTITVTDMELLTTELVAKALSAGRTHHVITANAQFYNFAERSQAFRDCAARAEYVCADGISIVMACKWFGANAVSRIAGVDLVEQICKRVADADLRVYFLGGKPGSAAAAARALSARYPGFKIAGISCPEVGFDQDPDALQQVLEDIKAVKPGLLFVALGAPRQEFFIDRYIRPLAVPVALGIGGSFEMISGRVRRAPRWVQSGGLEWAFRWMQEPTRLARRYLIGNFQFTCTLLRYLLRRNTPTRMNHEY